MGGRSVVAGSEWVAGAGGGSVVTGSEWVAGAGGRVVAGSEWVARVGGKGKKSATEMMGTLLVEEAVAEESHGVSHIENDVTFVHNEDEEENDVEEHLLVKT